MTIYLPVLIALIGILMFFVSTNPKVQRIGEIFVLSGTLAFLLRSGELIKIIG